MATMVSSTIAARVTHIAVLDCTRFMSLPLIETWFGGPSVRVGVP